MLLCLPYHAASFVVHNTDPGQQAPETASILPQGSLVDGALTPVNSPAYTIGGPQAGSWRSESKSKYTLAGPSGSTMQEMDSLLAAEKVCEIDLLLTRLHTKVTAHACSTSCSKSDCLPVKE